MCNINSVCYIPYLFLESSNAGMENNLACKLVQLEMDDEAPSDVWPHLLESTC